MDYEINLKKEKKAKLLNKFTRLYHKCNTIDEFLLKADLDDAYPKTWKLEARRYHFMIEHPIMHWLFVGICCVLCILAISSMLSSLSRFSFFEAMGPGIVLGGMFSGICVLAYAISFEKLHSELRN